MYSQFSNGFKKAVVTLGSAFLAHPNNQILRDKLISGELSSRGYYSQILYLSYRIVMLLIAEARDILFSHKADKMVIERYMTCYSCSRLCYYTVQDADTKASDLFCTMKFVMEKLGSNEGYPELGLPLSGGVLFSHKSMADLEECNILNCDLLKAIYSLVVIDDKRPYHFVNYKNLELREMGNLYETLLESQPLVKVESATFDLQIVKSNGRKSSGSYYTPSSLVKCLLDLTLDPLLDNACAESDPEKALLDLKVCDPACGGGSFLIAAAQRIAERLAMFRSDSGKQGRDIQRASLREVSEKSIYGVDLNPLAIELCKTSLWLQALEHDKSLFSLDHHIRCGNGLLGIELNRGLSDESWRLKMPKPIGDKQESHFSDEVKQVLFNPLLSEDLTDERVLECWLDDAVRAVKNVVSHAKRKELILSLLFYKYLSDLSDVSPLESESVILQPEYRWEIIQNHPVDGTLGDFITVTVREIASLKPDLKGILDLVNYGEYQEKKRVVSDAVLRRLIEIMSRYCLANVMKHLDFWNNAYGYLLERLPELDDDERGHFYTPREVVSLMVELIEPTLNDDLYDPACGSGCLSGLSYHMNNMPNVSKRDKKIVGQDKTSITSALAKMDLYFQDTAKIYEGDALRNLHLDENGDLPQFKHILANPPWNLSGYDEAFYQSDPQRFRYGIPPKRSADWGWVQCILASLSKKDGRAGIILDLGALSRGSGSTASNKERDIRKAVIEEDVIDAVISLPRNLFYGTAAPCVALLINSNKRKECKGHVLVIDALNYFPARELDPMNVPSQFKRRTLSQEEINFIWNIYTNWKAEKNFSCIVSLEELRSHNYELSPVCLVPKEIKLNCRPIDEIEADLDIISKQSEPIEVEIEKELKFASVNILGEDALDLRRDFKSLLKDNTPLSSSVRKALLDTLQIRERLLALEQERRRALSKQLFTYGTQNKQTLVTPIGQIPDDWEIVRLGDCAKIQSGTQFPRPSRDFNGELIPWVKAGDLNQEFVVETAEKVSVLATTVFSSVRRVIRAENTLLMAIYGGPSTVGKTAILGMPAVTNQAVCSIIPFDKNFDTEFLFCYLTYIRGSWMNYALGTRQDIHMHIVKERQIPRPGLDEQCEIVATLRPYSKRICELKQEITLLHRTLKA